MCIECNGNVAPHFSPTSPHKLAKNDQNKQTITLFATLFV